MSTAIAASNLDQRLALCKRGDLEFRPQRFASRRYWAVKDPVALRYFHLGEDEYQLLQMLDGVQSLTTLRERLNLAIAPRQASLEQIQHWLTTLHQFGLVYAPTAEQGTQLLIRQRQRRSRQHWEQLASLLAIRLPGINPRKLLDVLDPLVGWLFSPAAAVATAVAALTALLLLATQFEMIEARIPQLDAFASAANLPWLVLTLALVKSLHELGHALACRRLGGDCHELGVMLLVFAPALYCNVSDAWMMPNKWHRMAISAAGMYVELILATVCAVIWWNSEPGLLNSLCLNTVLICSVGTLLLNGNPLLRYDGYYLLSDLVEVPNLKSRASETARRLTAHYCLGIDLPVEQPTTGMQTAWLLLYAVASAVYRLLMIGMVLWMLDRILRPLHLEALVYGVGAVVVGGLLWPPLARLRRWASNPARRGIATLRLLATLAILGCGLCAVLWIPIPTYVSAPLVLEYRNAQRVYVSVPGRIEHARAAGERVLAGETILRLDNPQVRKQLISLRNERDLQLLLIANLEAQQLQGTVTGNELPAAKVALQDLQQRLEQLERDAACLTLAAPLDGVILAPPNVPREPTEERVLGSWTGTPLDEHNQGAQLDSGTLVCLVGDASELEAVLNLDERDVELVQAGQRVELRFDHLPGEIFTGQVSDVARLDLEVMPRELTASGALPGETDRGGRQRPLDIWYQARVQVDGEPEHLIARMPGRARVEVDSRSLGARILRRVRQTFAL